MKLYVYFLIEINLRCDKKTLFLLVVYLMQRTHVTNNSTTGDGQSYFAGYFAYGTICFEDIFYE